MFAGISFAPISRAIEQMDDPAFLKVIGASLVASGVCFGLLCLASFSGLHHAFAAHGWLGWLAGALGGIAVAVVALWLFLPFAVLVASLFLEPICRAVERRWYPGLGRPARAEGASLATQMWDGLAVGLRVLLLSAASLLLALFIPGIGVFLGWAITAWALGRGLFVAVAMRRMGRADATRLYAACRPLVLVQGAVLAFAGYVPLVNLLVPVLGTAAMVHVMELHRPERESWT